MTWLSLLITVLIAAVFLAILEEGLWEKGAWKPSSGFLELLGWLVVLDLLWPMGWGKAIELVLDVPEEWLVLEQGSVLVLGIWGIGVLFHAHNYGKSLLDTRAAFRVFMARKPDLFYRNIPVYVAVHIQTPMVIGWKKAIFLPEGKRWKENLILEHEYQHMRHHDFWIKQVINFLCIVYWWFPMIHGFRNNMALLLELRVDRVVTARMKKAEKIHYARRLLADATAASKLVLASGFFGSKKGSVLELRVQKILTTRRLFRNDFVLCMACCLVLGFGKMTHISLAPMDGTGTTAIHDQRGLEN